MALRTNVPDARRRSPLPVVLLAACGMLAVAGCHSGGDSAAAVPVAAPTGPPANNPQAQQAQAQALQGRAADAAKMGAASKAAGK